MDKRDTENPTKNQVRMTKMQVALFRIPLLRNSSSCMHYIRFHLIYA
jgi:hypothetical protein